MTKPALWMTMKPKVVKKRWPLRRRSKAMTAKMEDYNIQRELFLKRLPWCLACVIRCQAPPKLAKHIHHYAGRGGPNLLDTRGWLPVCPDCHRWIGDNPLKARQLGLICPLGKWNHPIKSHDHP